MPLLRGTKRRLARDPEMASVHHNEIEKLLEAGYVKIVEDAEDRQHKSESWYLPHHLITQATGKTRLVFNCSFCTFRGLSLNKNLLPGPTLGPSRLGVLLRFRQHAVAMSGDIRAMFHVVWLFPQRLGPPSVHLAGPAERPRTHHLRMASASIWHHLQPMLRDL